MVQKWSGLIVVRAESWFAHRFLVATPTLEGLRQKVESNATTSWRRKNRSDADVDKERELFEQVDYTLVSRI